jgi:hypothetical protein
MKSICIHAWFYWKGDPRGILKERARNHSRSRPLRMGVVDCPTQSCCCPLGCLSPRRPSTSFVVGDGGRLAPYPLRYGLEEGRACNGQHRMEGEMGGGKNGRGMSPHLINQTGPCASSHGVVFARSRVIIGAMLQNQRH